MSYDTIVAIATPLGIGGLGVVRLSGPASLTIAQNIFSAPLANATTHTLHHGWIKNGDAVIDEAVIAVFRAPRSYTGDDVIEISSHGSPAVLNTIVDLCRALGARLARPGEFTERAYLNGKMDLAQAEAVADLIHARSTNARDAAADQLRGGLSAQVRAVRARLIEVLAHVEANLDFVEEDIPGLPRDKMRADIAAVKDEIEKLRASGFLGRLLRDGVRVALVGKPNAGKSSLFNALVAHDRAIVSAVPGTTRDTLDEWREWNGSAVLLTDTAGLRAAKGAIEKKGVERTRRAVRLADVTIFVVDGARTLEKADEKIFRALNKKKVVVALNKSDRKHVTTPEKLQKKFGAGVRVVSTSATRNNGLDDLKAAVLAVIASASMEGRSAGVVTNRRHIECLDQAAKNLDRALGHIGQKTAEEAVAVDLRDAVRALGAVTGDDVGDEVLASIFKQFCIGK